MKPAESGMLRLMIRSEPNLLAITMRAHRDQLARVRNRMQRWLSDRNIPTSLCADIVLATDEALANSVEHAYRPRSDASAVINLAVQVHPDTVSVSVVDHGRWRRPAAEGASTRAGG